jgi:uncharacterized protein (TIGR02246 family)
MAVGHGAPDPVDGRHAPTSVDYNGPMETEATRQLVQRFLEARNAGDAAAMTELLSEDASWYPPPSMGLGPFEGRDKAVKALAGGAAGKIFDLSTLRRTIHKVIADGDTAVVLQQVAATTVKGADYCNEYAWVYTCAEGRITRLDEFADSLYAARVFGMVKS